TESDRQKKTTRTSILKLDQPNAEATVIWSRNTQDRYRDPGTIVRRSLPNGQDVAAQSGDYIFLAGQGSSPQGDLPFFDRFNLKTLQSERIFRSAANTYESFVSILNDDGTKFLTRHETSTEPPNLYLRTAGSATPQILTNFADPTPILRKIK